MFESMRTVSGVLILLCCEFVAQDTDKSQPAPTEKPKPAAPREPAPKDNYYRSMPKSYARLLSVDAAGRAATFAWEKDGTEHTLPLRADAEIQRFGFWASLDEFQPNERVYLAIDTDSSDRWLSVHSLLDGVSIQAIFSDHYTVKAWDVPNARAELAQDGGKKATVAARIGPGLTVAQKGREPVSAGQRVYWNARYDGETTTLADVLGAADLARARAEQVQRQFGRLASEGLHAVVNDIDAVDGRLVLTVSPGGALWARTLRMNDKVQVSRNGPDTKPIDSLVYQVRPDYAKAKVRLVAEGKPLASLRLGDEVRLHMDRPTDLDPDLPPDLGRLTARADRISWFLSSVYCTCGMPHDG